MTTLLNLVNERARINRYFHTNEFLCRCGCGYVYIDPDFFLKLMIARVQSDVPYNLNSASRCERHNEAVGGSDQSGHKFGKAVDVRARTVGDLHAILRGAFFARFHGIIVGLNKDKTEAYVHMDSRDRILFSVKDSFLWSKLGLAA